MSGLEGAGRPDSAEARASRYPLPTRREWGLLAIALLFVAGGLLLLPSKPGVAIVTLAFFGTCAAVFIAGVLQKYRFRRFQAASVQVTGGVPIRPQRGRFLLLGGWLALLGLVMVFAGQDYPWLFRILSGAISVIGFAVLGAVLIGGYPREFLQFDPDGLTIAGRVWAARIPWDSIVNLREAFVSDNPMLLIDIRDAEAVTVDPPGARDQLLAALGRGRAANGPASFTIMPMTYGIDLPVLTAAIARYVLDANARGDLAKRGISAG